MDGHFVPAHAGGVIGINKVNRKVPLPVFLLCLVLTFIGFGLWGKSNFEQYDQEYGFHAQEFYSKTRVLNLLNENRIDEAKKVLVDETESIGSAVAICLMNNCSREAKRVRDEHKNL